MKSKSAEFYHISWSKKLRKNKQQRSIHVHAAVHVQRTSRDVRSTGRSEKHHGVRDVVDRAESRKRNRIEKTLALILGERARHVGVDETRRDAVHGDVAA